MDIAIDIKIAVKQQTHIAEYLTSVWLQHSPLLRIKQLGWEIAIGLYRPSCYLDDYALESLSLTVPMKHQYSIVKPCETMFYIWLLPIEPAEDFLSAVDGVWVGS